MMPLLPVRPSSTADFWSSMYFFLRSSWPQVSRITSTLPSTMPAQESVSVRFLIVTVQPSFCLIRYAITAVSAA